MASNGSLLRSLRTLHLYLGVFIAPALIFFAFTGALQTFGLHESSRDNDYQPPKWVVALAQIHKKQTVVVQVRKPAPAQNSATPGSPSASSRDRQSDRPQAKDQQRFSGPKRHPLPLRIFFLVVAISLIASTCSGIYMAYKYRRGKTLITGLLISGLIIPLLLLFI
jgi:uncharacterized iron-regulated membrane protein